MARCRFYLLGAQAILLLAMGQLANGAKQGMEVIYEFKYIDYDFQSEKAREEAIQNNEYVPKNITAFEFDTWNGRYFITTPRTKYGVPATISEISNKTRDDQNLLTPFPSWKDNRLGHCGGLTSVYTSDISKSGMMWLLDSGTVDIYGKVPDRFCSPKLVVYDLAAGDKLIGSYTLPNDVLDCNSQLIYLRVDRRNNNTKEVAVYMTDIYGNHLIVFDVQKKTFQRVTNNLFLPNPDDVRVTVDGVELYRPAGIISLALGPVCDDDRRVYFHALASREECWVMASTIRDEAYATNERAYPDSFYCYDKLRDSPSAIETITDDDEGIIFFNMETKNAVACWNTNLSYNMEKTPIVAQNDTTMQTIEVLKYEAGVLYGLSSRLQIFGTKGYSLKEVNIRVLRAVAKDLIRGTTCEKRCP